MSTNENENRIIELAKEEYKGTIKTRIVEEIMDYEKKTMKPEEITNDWKNNRYEELNKKNEKEILDMIIKIKIPELNSLKPENVDVINKLFDIYDTIKIEKKSELDFHKVSDTHAWSELFVKELKTRDIKIDSISEGLIEIIGDELSRTLHSILEYVVNIYPLYDSTATEKKYAVVCNVSGGDNLDCYIGEIIPKEKVDVLEEFGDEDMLVYAEEKAFKRDDMKDLFTIDLNKYIDWDEVTAKALIDVKKKFPVGTTVLLEE